MTTPRPTAEQVTAPLGASASPDLPSWLPDEATLNRLAGEFFAALPGSASPTVTGRSGGQPVSDYSGVEQAPRVDVPATATDIPGAPGTGGALPTGGLSSSGAANPASFGATNPGIDPTGSTAGSLPGLSVTDPFAALGISPGTSVPDVTQASSPGFGGEAFSGSPMPESPLVPGITGLQLTPPGELTPPLPGLSAPLPSAGVPGLPASDQAFTGGGAPTASTPEPTAAVPFTSVGQLGVPGAPTVPSVPGMPGATGASSGPGRAPATAAPDGFDLDSIGSDPFAGNPFGSAGRSAGPGQSSNRSSGRSPSRGEAASVPSAQSLGVSALGAPVVPQPPAPLPESPAPVPTPSTPYYFVGESSPYRPTDDSGLDTLVAAALNQFHVAPPAADPLVARANGGGTSVDDTSQAKLASPVFYFVERSAPESDAVAPRGALGRDSHPSFDVHRIRRDFPILAERVNGKPLVWLDNAATTQKPQAVLDRLAHFYAHENSNIHRAAHELAARATDAYEGARKTVARFIGAQSEKEIIFVRGATEAINLVAKSWGKANIHRGDEIIISHLEHHANIVPWQMLIAETGAKLRVIPVDDSGQLILSEYGRLLSDKTKLVAVTQVSNALGTVTPTEHIVEMGHRAGACVLIDGAQSVPHLRVNMQTLGADFFVFSGHKIFGPTGIGVVYGRSDVLESMPPWEGGGNMIADVTFEKTVYQKPPNRFEAGTGNIADAVGLGAALDYVSRLGVEAIASYEHALLEYATPRMKAVPGLHLIGTATHKASVLSFVLDGYRTEEVGTALNQEGIAVRSGHHCAQPILRRFGLETTVRPSLAFYNTREEIDLLVSVLHRLAANRGRR